MFVARIFYALSVVSTVALLLWAGIAWLLGDQSGTFPAAFGLWFASALPFLTAGMFVHALRGRRTSLSMPSHLPDGKRY